MPDDDDARPAPGSPQEKLPATLAEQRGWAVLHLLEPSLMDPAVIEALNAHVERLLSAGRRNLILDFAQVQYISSSMVGVLVGARHSVARASGRLVLAGLNRRLHELLKITRLQKMFVVEPDVAAALANQQPAA